MPLERPEMRPAGPIGLLRDLSVTTFANGFIGFIFAASGPLAVILAVASRGGLSEAQIASWIFGAFGVNGLLSVVFCLVYRQPLAFFWTIPGTVLLGPAMTHLTWSEIVGAMLATGLFMLVLGLSGIVRRAMEAIPMPIVMGMVAGVFLQFGLDWVKAFQTDIRLALPMTAVWLLLTALPRIGRFVPPLIGALIVGIVMAVATGTFAPVAGSERVLVAPELVVPVLSWRALAELVLPLAVTVLAAQNAQGIAIVTAAGHRPPINAITVACGAVSMVTAMIGSVSTCLTGPTNAILTSAGARERQYTGGVVVGLFAIAFGLVSPLVTRVMLATPTAFIATLAGLAMLRVLLAAFSGAFKGAFGTGALVCFLVTVSGLAIFNIGAPFWGLVFGYLVSRLVEARDFETGAR